MHLIFDLLKHKSRILELVQEKNLEEKKCKTIFQNVRGVLTGSVQKFYKHTGLTGAKPFSKILVSVDANFANLQILK